MPLSLIHLVLGACFALIWIFIAVMIFRDGRFALRDERESEILRADGSHGPQRPHADFAGHETHRGKDRRTSAA